MTDIFTTAGPAELPEDREVLDTQSMLETAFLQNLRTTTKGAAHAEQIAGAPAGIARSLTPSGEVSTLQTTAAAQLDVQGGTESLLLDLYEVRDGLIEVFENLDHDSSLCKFVTANINMVGGCIMKLGGQVENFVPLMHISGLTKPSLSKTAERVVETTKQCYSLGSVGDDNILNDGKTIELTFSGQTPTIQYKAVAKLTASKGWVGNEAIDYIYSGGSGNLTVKSFEKGKWVDKSADTDYHIYWELFEENLQEVVEAPTTANVPVAKEVVVEATTTAQDPTVPAPNFKITDVTEG